MSLYSSASADEEPLAENEPSGETARTLNDPLNLLRLLKTAGDVDVSACREAPAYTHASAMHLVIIC